MLLLFELSCDEMSMLLFANMLTNFYRSGFRRKQLLGLKKLFAIMGGGNKVLVGHFFPQHISDTNYILIDDFMKLLY